LFSCREPVPLIIVGSQKADMALSTRHKRWFQNVTYGSSAFHAIRDSSRTNRLIASDRCALLVVDAQIAVLDAARKPPANIGTRRLQAIVVAFLCDIDLSSRGRRRK